MKNIEDFKNDPFVKLLQAIVGDEAIVNDALNELQKEESKDNTSDSTIAEDLANTFIFIEGVFNTSEINGVDLRKFSDGLVYNCVWDAIRTIIGIYTDSEKANNLVNINRNLSKKDLVNKINFYLQNPS